MKELILMNCLIRKLKVIALTIFTFCYFNMTIAQTNSVDHWETVIYSDDTFKYFIGNSEPDANWRELSYNDNLWSQGPGGIEYGDGDDNTEIEPCISLYLRIKFESSDIPIMVIDTEGRDIVDEPKTMVRMGIIYNGPGQRNSLSDPFNEYDGWIGIEYRGNASMSFPKKPYTFETRNENGTNNNVELLDMPKENDFILRAAYIDKTLMRDALSFHLSRGLGRWAPRTRHVELILNGEYQGIYILVEKIKPDKNRLNIVRMNSSDTTGEALTGGYIWSVQQSDYNDVVFLSDRREGNNRVLKYPKPDEVTPEQLEYIRQYEESFRNVMKSSIYNDPEKGYSAYIDVSTFIDEILVQEVTANSDAYGWSSFFYKDRNSKMSAGPAWDFDQALSNSTYNNGHHFDEFVIEKTIDWARPSFWDKLWADTDFKDKVIKKWLEYRKGPFKIEQIFAFIDSVALYLNEAQQCNFQQWPILGVEIWRSTPGVEERNTYQKEVDYMKDWLVAHLDWMDTQLYQTQPPDTFDMIEGRIAYYKFDEGVGATVFDHSGNGLDGEITGDARYDEGIVGGGLAFNGEDSYVNCGNPAELNMTNELTLMAWVYPHDITDGGQHDPWISKGDQQYALKNGAGDYFEFFIYDNTWYAPRVELDESYNDEWHHYAGTYNGAELKMYIDGELLNTYDHEGMINTTDFDFYLGSNSQVGGRFFNGILDEVMVYDIALSDAEIADIYKSTNSIAVKNQPVHSITDFVLHQNYPNPFNPITMISYSIKKPSQVRLIIYDLLCREIITLVKAYQTPDTYTVRFDASNLISGIYFYQLQINNKMAETKKMILLR